MAIKRKTINLTVSGNDLTPTDAATGLATTDAGVQGENEAVWLHADVPADWQDLTVRLRVTALDGTFDESAAAVSNAVDMPLRQGVLVPGRLAVALVGLSPDGDTGNYLVRKSADCRMLTVQASAQPLDPAAELYPQDFESLKDEVQGACIHTVVGRGAAQVERLDGQTVAVGFTGGGGGDMLAANYSNGSGAANSNMIDHAIQADSASHAASADAAVSATTASTAASADHASSADVSTTQSSADNSTKIATTAMVQSAVAPFKAMPKAHVYSAAAFTVHTNTDTALPFDTERYDTDSIFTHVASPYRLTCNTAGYYMIFATIMYPQSSSGAKALYLRVNGGARFAPMAVPSSGIDTDLSIGTALHLNAGDYVEAVTFHTSGSDVSIGPLYNGYAEFGMHCLERG